MPNNPNKRFTFTTGDTQLPDIGIASYNGCTFSPYFQSNISGKTEEDEAGRTVKYTEVTLTLDGYVTIDYAQGNAPGALGPIDGTVSIAPTMVTMYQLLTQQGGALVYQGRGFDFVVNKGGTVFGLGQGLQKGGYADVAWGPVPKLIDFQPLGGGLSAKVKWQVTFCVSAQKAGSGFFGSNGQLTQLLQFNYETSVTYGEDGFSTLSMRGTLEIPMTRQLNRFDVTVPATADDYRIVIQRQLLRGIDLSRFRVTRRNFDTSRDKRTLTWDFSVEEKPYMDLPPYCTIARGSYSVKPAKAGLGLCLWLCTLQVTYTLRADTPRRQAWVLFLALMRQRMSESVKGNIPGIAEAGNKQVGTKIGLGIAFDALKNPFPALLNPKAIADKAILDIKKGLKEVEDVRKAQLLDFNINEGLYLDSKTITFSATWRICTTFSHILAASGLWSKIAEEDAIGDNLWATTMKGVSGTSSWLQDRVDRTLDVIVDFGSSQ